MSSSSSSSPSSSSNPGTSNSSSHASISGGGRGRGGRGTGRGRSGRGGPRKRSHNDNDSNNNNNNNSSEGRGRGAGRGSGGQGQQQQGQQQHHKGRLIRISKALSWALRHGATELGLNMTPDGFCPVQQIIQHDKYKSLKMTLDEVQQVVETNDKQRFKLEQRPKRDYQQYQQQQQPQRQQQQNSKDGASGTAEAAAVANDDDDDTLILCIRANQGHSVSGIIDPHLLLSPLSPEQLANTPIIVHGTYLDTWPKIQQTGGLKRMNRHHIHFATGMSSDGGVISGMRQSSQVYIYINGSKCARDGIVFFQSDNGVLLTAGKEEETTSTVGMLPIAYFSHVMDNKGNVLLDQRDGRND